MLLRSPALLIHLLPFALTALTALEANPQMHQALALPTQATPHMHPERSLQHVSRRSSWIANRSRQLVGFYAIIQVQTVLLTASPQQQHGLQIKDTLW